MLKNIKIWFVVLVVSSLLGFGIVYFLPKGGNENKIYKTNIQSRDHLDHSAFFNEKFKSPQDVTKRCLECHEDAATDLMKTTHWSWNGNTYKKSEADKPINVGKKNIINNFCISIVGNWAGCTSCHAGYGWKDDNFDFNKKENVDCLVCHDWSGTYAKGTAGMPNDNVDLVKVAKSVGYPKRDNCGTCHYYGGGGLGVKHGDLDNSLNNPSDDIDIHMGKHNLQCIDCHKTTKHNVTGNAYSVSSTPENGVNCTDCHTGTIHKDERINSHLDAVACQTCHIPTYAKKIPTKMEWHWSKAGDDTKKDDVHKYLKKKGEFVYDENIKPEYHWFNMNANHYIIGDKIENTNEILNINTPLGNIADTTAKIWPFKIHRGDQIYDIENKYIIPPVTYGEGGYWNEFNWDKAARLGSELHKLPYSGKYGFIKTQMYWPLSHMVSKKEDALKCESCHGDNSVLNWKQLGYEGDPMKFGSRKKSVK